VCHRSVSVRRNGATRIHRAPVRLRIRQCPGSGRPAV
jgi:hypothetical protein